MKGKIKRTYQGNVTVEEIRYFTGEDIIFKLQHKGFDSVPISYPYLRVIFGDWGNDIDKFSESLAQFCADFGFQVYFEEDIHTHVFFHYQT